MSQPELENFVKPLDNKNLDKKVIDKIDNFWEDCIESPKLKESKKKLFSNSNNADEDPEDYITCILKKIFLLIKRQNK